MGMEEKCEFFKKCRFFTDYQHNTEVVKAGWIRMYCENKEKSEKCTRKRLFQEKGEMPLDNMTPDGQIL